MQIAEVASSNCNLGKPRLGSISSAIVKAIKMIAANDRANRHRDRLRPFGGLKGLKRSLRNTKKPNANKAKAR